MMLPTQSHATKLKNGSDFNGCSSYIAEKYPLALLVSLKWMFFGVKFGCGLLITQRLCENMGKHLVPEPGGKRDWVLTQATFRRFLEWLDSGIDSGGLNYLEIRSRLVFYFDRKNSTIPDELADETLNRVARRLEEEGEIQTDAPAHYCYIVARFVFLESLRTKKDSEVLDDRFAATPDLNEEQLIENRRKQCLERCMQSLTPEERFLIVRYYQGTQRSKIENRRALAANLGLTMNALSIRACRIREKLERCMRKYLDELE
jgi:DNA-directed RNA polymerase specialized sigma24 family protein